MKKTLIFGRNKTQTELTESLYVRRQSSMAYTHKSDHQGKLRWVVGYVIYASILWSITAIFIYLRSDNQQESLLHTDACCYCWSVANHKIIDDSWNNEQIDWTHCIDDCSCNKCDIPYQLAIDIDNYNTTNSTNYLIECSNLDNPFKNETTYPPNPSADKGCYTHLSTSSLFGALNKSYDYYGYMAIFISILQILLLWSTLAIYRTINVGILFFVHSIVNAEICYYSTVKNYQFILQPNGCYYSIFKSEFEQTIWDIVGYSLILHVVLQWMFSCSRCCFIKCKAGKKVYRWCGSLVGFVSVISILWALFVYAYIADKLRIILSSGEYQGKFDVSIIIVVISLFLAVFGIFPWPFCREVTCNICKSYWTYYIYSCSCCQEKTTTSPYYKRFESLIEEEEKSMPLLNLETDDEDGL